jgi:hypothetical protein
MGTANKTSIAQVAAVGDFSGPQEAETPIPGILSAPVTRGYLHSAPGDIEERIKSDGTFLPRNPGRSSGYASETERNVDLV